MDRICLARGKEGLSGNSEANIYKYKLRSLPSSFLILIYLFLIALK